MKYIYFIIIFVISISFFGEIAVRYLRSEIKVQLEPIIESKEFHHNYIPNFKWYVENSIEDGGEKIELITNNISIRGDIKAFNNPDVKRILIIGDSFIQADEIAFENTIGEHIENYFSSQNVDVIQHGIASWAPLLILNWYNKIGKYLKPNIVIVQICVNDFAESYDWSDVAYTKVCEWDDIGLPKIFNIKDYKPSSFKIFLLKHSSFILALKILKAKISLLWLRKESETLMAHQMVKQDEINELLSYNQPKFQNKVRTIFPDGIIADLFTLSAGPKYWNNKINENIERSMKYIEKLNQLVVNNKGTLVVIDAPMGWCVGPSECKIGKRKYFNLEDNVLWPYGIGKYFKKRFNEMGVIFVDLQPKLSEISNGTIYNNKDEHWSKNGHSKIAEILVGEIEPLLP